MVLGVALDTEQEGNNIEGWQGKTVKKVKESKTSWVVPEFSPNALFCKSSGGQAGTLPKLQRLFTVCC